MRRLAALFCLLIPGVAGGDAPSGPVVVELFTSEGCSSCPPADDVLRAIDETNKSVIALEFHVDYWNELGWPDPYSKAEWSARQRAYGNGKSGSYTPQAIIDGGEEMIGSRSPAIADAIARASQKPHLKVEMSRTGDSVVVRAPAFTGDDRAEMLFAIVERGHTTAVPRGENAGRTLRHGPVVRELRSLGMLGPSSFEARMKVGSDTRRFVAFVQLQKSHRIVGSAAL
jgi:hypothetical protein